MADAIRKSDLAFALSVTRKRLDNWLQRGLISLTETDYGGDGWTNFAVADVQHLAVVNRLVDFRMTVAEADGLAREAEALLTEQLGRRAKETDPAARWSGRLVAGQRSDTPSESVWAVAVVTRRFQARKNPAFFVDAGREIANAMARLALRRSVKAA